MNHLVKVLVALVLATLTAGSISVTSIAQTTAKGDKVEGDAQDEPTAKQMTAASAEISEKAKKLPSKQKAEFDKAVEKSKKLTPQQKAEFVKGAKEVGKLTDEQIEQALNDPVLLAGTPVKEEAAKPVEGASAKLSSSSDATTAATEYCKSASQTFNQYNLHGHKLFYFYMKKRWCYDYYWVTYWYWPVRYGDATSFGSTVGWSYSGIRDWYDSYLYGNGNSYGRHYSWRQARFDRCVAGYCFSSSSPSIGITGYYNGRVYYGS